MTPRERAAPGYERGLVWESQIWLTSLSSLCHILLPAEATGATTFVTGALERREMKVEALVTVLSHQSFKMMQREA